jgi:hypothetical protein
MAINARQSNGNLAADILIEITACRKRSVTPCILIPPARDDPWTFADQRTKDIVNIFFASRPFEPRLEQSFANAERMAVCVDKGRIDMCTLRQMDRAVFEYDRSLAQNLIKISEHELVAVAVERPAYHATMLAIGLLDLIQILSSARCLWLFKDSKVFAMRFW